MFIGEGQGGGVGSIINQCKYGGKDLKYLITAIFGSAVVIGKEGKYLQIKWNG